MKLIHKLDDGCTVSADLFLSVSRELEAYRNAANELRKAIHAKDLNSIKDAIRKVCAVKREK